MMHLFQMLQEELYKYSPNLMHLFTFKDEFSSSFFQTILLSVVLVFFNVHFGVEQRKRDQESEYIIYGKHYEA